MMYGGHIQTAAEGIVSETERKGEIAGAGMLLGIAIALAGWMIGDGFRDGRSEPRTVVVKGLAERAVEADLAVWSLRFVTTDNALETGQAALTQAREKVYAFLRDAGFEDAEFRPIPAQVTDKLAQAYGNQQFQTRFVLSQAVVLRTGNVRAVRAAAGRLGDLFAEGVVLSAEYGAPTPIYLFTGLNAIKADMISEALAAARDTAQAFADDSGAELDGIRRANQGVFEILPRDRVPGQAHTDSLEKTVRVVTTVTYGIGE